MLDFLSQKNVKELLSNPTTIYYIERLCSEVERQPSVSKHKPQRNKEVFTQLPLDKEESEMQLMYDIENESPNLLSPNPKAAYGTANDRRREKDNNVKEVLAPGLITGLLERNVSRARILKLIGEYLPIAVFIAKIKNMTRNLDKLAYYMKQTLDISAFNEKTILLDEKYMHLLLRHILLFEENKIFKELLAALPNMDIILDEKFISLFETEYRFDQLLEVFRLLESKMVKQMRSSLSTRKTFSLGEQAESLDQRLPYFNLTHSKLILITNKYMLCTHSNDLLLAIYKHLSMSNQEIVDIMLEAGEDERLISLSNNIEDIVNYINDEDLICKARFTALVLFDKSELINIFNKQYDEKMTVYEKICRLIASGKNAESLCAVIMHVHSTFWDMQKLPKFYKAMLQVFSDMKPSNKINKDGSKSKESWLVHIESPLLFCVKMLYFLKKMKKQLDFKEMEITQLMLALQAFCICFCKTADEDVLMINLFEKDSDDRDFLEYAFLLQDMTILEIEFVESVIYRMWDLGRHTMQTLTQFMRLNFFSSEIHKFSMDVFKKKFEMPIEDDDSFQLEFRYTSNSVFMRIASEMAWPFLIISFEFIFSLMIIRYYKNFQFTDDWLTHHFKMNPVFSVVHIYLRASLLLSNLLKSILLKKFKRDGFYHYYFYNLLHALFFIQLIIYPIFYINEFMMVSIVQMLIVLTMIGYVWYNGISLNNIGIILRIFANMVYVVVVFGIVSILVMLMIAYPIHSVFIDFSQVVGGDELNVFRSLYQGVLTLYEFVFGAVVFVRPYLEQNVYTHAITFIMVIFSFFGNIMVANILIAFLSRQFEEITRLAKYYTMRMQFGLVKIFDMEDLDTMFSMPYPLLVPAIPAYFLMIRPGPLRKRVNRFLKKVIHIVNIFIPALAVMLVYLSLLFPIRYIEVLISILIKIPLQPKHIVYTFVWIVVGPLLLIKLFALDLATICKVMLDFSGEEEDLLSPKLNLNAQESSIKTFKNVIKAALYFNEIYEKIKGKNDIDGRIENTVTIQDFLSSMGAKKGDKRSAKKSAPFLKEPNQLEHNDSNNSDSESVEEKEHDPDDFGISFTSKYSAIYSQPQEVLIRLLLKKFTIQRSPNEDVENLKVDLTFMLRKLKKNVNLENIHRLIGFDKTTLYKASKLIRKNQEADVMTELSLVKERVGKLDKQMDEVMSELSRVRDLQNTFVEDYRGKRNSKTDK